MLSVALRVLAGMPAVLLLAIGARWLIDPAGAAGSMGMPLLDGLARSSQIGDLSAFFLVTGALIAFGVIRERPGPLWVASALLTVTALARCIAWAAHGADFAGSAIAIEVVSAALSAGAAMNAPRMATTPD